MKKTSPTTTHSVTVQGLSYHIRRRGSRYNILGPDGRVFSTFQSASAVGPRWEELTRTPWPHPSTAYEPGFRLRQLRAAARDLAPLVSPPANEPVPEPTVEPASGEPNFEAEAEPIAEHPVEPSMAPATEPAPAPTPEPAAKQTPTRTAKRRSSRRTQRALDPASAPSQPHEPKAARLYQLSLTVPFTPAPVMPFSSEPPARSALQITAPPLALPAPRLNLAEHELVMQQLRRHPPLLFTPRIREALRHEVEYHRPQAAWAGHLLKLLGRYDARQRKQRRSHVQTPDIILEKHLAWQAQQRVPV